LKLDYFTIRRGRSGNCLPPSFTWELGSGLMNKKMNWWQKNIKIKKKNHQYWLWSVFPLGIIEGIKG